MVIKAGLRLVIYAALLVAMMALLQDQLLYHPDNPPRAALLEDARRSGLTPWPDAGDYRGLRVEPATAPRATVVLFHGNAGHAGHRDWFAAIALRHGLRVILAEYPGYGSRPGKIGEASLVGDALDTLALARRTFPGPLLVAGESLGCGVAAAAAGQVAGDIAGILLITPWDRLVHVARHHYPWLPVDWLLRDRYESDRHLAGMRQPTALLIAENDHIVPAAFGRALFEGLQAPKRLWQIPGADHNDWLHYMADADWQALWRFLLPGAPHQNGAADAP